MYVMATIGSVPKETHLHGLGSDLGLAHAHVALAKEELAVQVANLDGIHVHLQQYGVMCSHSKYMDSPDLPPNR